MDQKPVEILLIDASPTIESAFQQVFSCFGMETVASEFGRLDETVKNKHLLAPVVACNPETWRFMRSANIWQEGEGWIRGREAKGKRGAMPAKVLCAVAPGEMDLFDHYCRCGIGSRNLVYAFLKHLELLDGAGIALLCTAVWRWIAARERHSLKPDFLGFSAHGDQDFHAALRVIHGAVLSGWLSPEKAQVAYEAVCHQAGIDSENLPLSFFSRAAARIVGNRYPEAKVFSSLAIIDNEPHWAKAIQPLFEQRGISTIQHGDFDQTVIDQIVASWAPGGSHAVRSVLLDLEFSRNKRLVGAAYLPPLRSACPGIPVIVYSVEDSFSQTALLKQLGAFCYVSKQPGAEVTGARDEITAFSHLRDAVLLAQWASLKKDLFLLWNNACQRDPLLCGTLNGYVNRALDSIFDGCRSIFHSAWQDSGVAHGLICRQIIRAFGLLNDKWCEYCASSTGLGYDPDGKWPDEFLGKSWPNQTYHRIATLLRNEASHAMVDDECFEWLDAWVMVLSTILKIDGMADGVGAAVTEPFARARDDVLDRLTLALSSLMRLSGYLVLSEDSTWATSPQVSAKHAANTLAHLRQWRDARRSERAIHLDGNGNEYFFSDGNYHREERVSIFPYALRANSSYLIHELPRALDVHRDLARHRSNAQWRADALLMYFIGARSAAAISPEMPSDAPT